MNCVWLAKIVLLLSLSLSLLVCCTCTSSSSVSVSVSVAPRKKVLIQGSVICNYCVNDPGSISKPAPLPGAVVKLQCNNTNKPWEEKTTTDSKGGYVLRPEKVSTWGAQKCKIFEVSSPRSDCPVIPYDTQNGVVLKSTPTNTTSPFHLFTVETLYFLPGPFMCL